MSSGSEAHNRFNKQQAGRTSPDLVVEVPTSSALSDFTGERFHPGLSTEMELEHLHRYLFALPHVKDRVVLDIASGEGYGSYILSQFARSVIGVDIDPTAVMAAAQRYQRGNLSYREGSCATLPVPDNSVDVLISFETLEHIEDHDGFLKEIKRVLRPDGLLIMSSPEREAYGTYRTGENEFHVKELNRDEYETLLKRYFRNVTLGAQRNVFASVINGESFEGDIQLLSREDAEVRAVKRLPKSPYLLAVASNNQLPDLSPSLFDNGVNPYIISALRGGIEERDAEILTLRLNSFNRAIELLEGRGEIAERELGDTSEEADLSLKKVKNVLVRLADRGAFDAGQPLGKVMGLIERVNRKMGRPPLNLRRHKSFDSQFIKEWGIDTDKNAAGVAAEYKQDPYRTPRLHFRRGELPQLLVDIDRLVKAGGSLRAPNEPSPTVSVIIPIFNQLRITLYSLRSILNVGARIPFEIILVDDCSAPEVEDILRGVAGVRYIRQPKNGGFIASCNKGASEARGEYVLFLNNDTHVLPGWLDELHETFRARPKAGLVGSQLIYPNGLLQEAGGILWGDGSAWNYGRNGDRLSPEFNYLRPVDYCSGASIMLPRALFDELGQFDKHYTPAYAEDVDLALKVRDAGYEVLYQPLSKIVHFEGISSGTDVTKGVKSYQVENLKKLFERWKDKIQHHRPGGHEPELERDRGVSKRVLFLDALTPTPDRDAGSVVIHQFMRIFLNLGYGVSFVPEDNLLPIEGYTQVLQRMGVECWHYPHISSVQQYLQEHGNKFDLVFMYRAPHAAKHLDAVKAYCPRAKVVLNTVDLHFLREERQAQIENSQAKLKAAHALKEKELDVMRRTDATILLNRSEVELISQLAPTVKTFMLPLTQEVPGCRKRFSERKDIVFIGGFNHLPNIDAVRYFCTEVMPLLRQRLPGVKLIVVGSNPPAELQRLACDDVEIRGFVANLDEIFDNCRASVAPLRFGAGMKGKIVTSLSYGVPCVTTTVGSEGMGLSHGENIIVADDAATCSEALADLLSSEQLWNALSKAGVDFAKSNFSPEVVAPQIQEMIKELGI